MDIKSVMRMGQSKLAMLKLRGLRNLIARMISHCIVGHHSGLLNGISVGEGTSLERRLTKTVDPYLDNIGPENDC